MTVSHTRSGIFFTLLVAISCSLVLVQCRKEKFTTDSSSMLEFSRDTIFFDTVFSTVGSTTQYLKVRNNHDESIKISEIVLETGSNSQYRINVDGLDGPQTDVEILPNDSIFIFVEVTIDPADAGLPFIVEDNLRFITNGNVQRVVLQAWGQDAHFHGGLNSCSDPFSEIITGSEIWGDEGDDLPHVIYGIIAVDEGASLTIAAGTQVYCHGKSGIYVFKGQLHVEGELGNEVVFQGDRLEPGYANISGQWGIQLDCPIETGVGPTIASIIRGGIWLYQSAGSTIDYAIIKNGNMGIQVDTTDAPLSGSNFALKITNTKITNMAGIGIWGQGGSIKGQNLLVANCGQSCAYFSIGGKYQMDNCTFGNYWSDNSRTAPAFALNNYYEDVDHNLNVRPLVNCDFNNCIMFGNNAFLTDFSEFVVDINTDAPVDYVFRHCLVDTDSNVDDGGEGHFVSMNNGLGPYLCDPANGNFKVSSNEPVMQGAFTGAEDPLTFDIEGNAWSGIPLKGCYTFNGNGGDNPCD